MTPVPTTTSTTTNTTSFTAPVPLTFPPSSSPRVWLLTSGPCPVGITVARALLEHGDSIVLGLPRPIEGIDVPGSSVGLSVSNGATGLIEGEEERNNAFKVFWEGARDSGVQNRCRVVSLDAR